MKKKPNVRAGGQHALEKISMVMKLCLFLLSFLVYSVSAKSMAQNVKLSMEKKSESLVKVLNELGEKSGYEFFYNDDEVSGVNVSVSVKNATVREILESVLKGTSLVYHIVDNVIVISPKVNDERPVAWRVSGVVKDGRGMPLIGVTVSLKGTTVGVATDKDGKFIFEFQKRDSVVLVFSFVGMVTQEKIIRTKETKNLVVVMKEDVGELDEVVITGFGSKAKNSYTGAATSVDRKQLLTAGTRSLLKSLAAFVPGMQIVTNNDMGSDPNTKPEILIRGRSSFEGASNVPTFIVDGAEVSLDYVFDMDVNDVENVTVLKDASASALYGAKASKGVIVITTKPLKGGKMRVSYDGTFGASFPDLSDYDLLNAEEKLEYERRAHLYDGMGDDGYEKDVEYNEIYKRVRAGVDTDWMSKPLRNSFTQNHNVNISGGDDFIRYSLSVRYGSEEGVMKESKRDRYSMSFKLSYNKQDRFFINSTTTINVVNNENSPYGSFSKYVDLNPYDPVYNEDGSWNKLLTHYIYNPLYEASLGSYDKGEQFYLNTILNLRVEVLKGLRMEGQFSLNKSKDDTEVFVSPQSNTFNDVVTEEKGSITVSNTKRMTYEGRLMLTYNKMFGESTLLNVLGGGTISSSDGNSNSYSGVGIFSDKLAHPAFTSRYPENGRPTGSQDIERSMGFFVNGNMIYDNRYFLDVAIRYEGSSKFGSDQRYAPFWSVGGGWNIHKEKFMPTSATDVLKLRASVGYTGNASFSPYQAMTTYKYDADLNYGKGIGAVPMAIGNPDLKWERTLTYNAGLDVVLFSNRWDMTLDWYRKVTDDLLLDVTKAPSVGTSSAKENIGKLQNNGIEFQTRVTAINNQNWNWAMSLTIQHNENKIKKISNALKAMNEKLNAEKTLLPPPVYEEGQSISAVKAVKSGGIDPATGQEIYIDIDGNPTFTYNYWDKRVYGDANPDMSGVFGSYLTFKGFSLNMMFDYSFGGTIYNQTLVSRVEGSDPLKNADKRVFSSRWKEAGDQAKYKDIADSSMPEVTSRFIRDEYYLNMRSLSLSYDFTSDFCKKIYLSRLRVQFMTNDLFRISTVKQERGLTYPFARTFEFSLSAAF
ncbi:MAG: SusC/RagA family protein [Butyricimonas synergistica]|nr:MAG: SusC/RagA family protein [Butyricimonas synergistica]